MILKDFENITRYDLGGYGGEWVKYEDYERLLNAYRLAVSKVLHSEKPERTEPRD